MGFFTNLFLKKGMATIKSRQVVLKVAFPFNMILTTAPSYYCGSQLLQSLDDKILSHYLK